VPNIYPESYFKRKLLFGQTDTQIIDQLLYSTTKVVDEDTRYTVYSDHWALSMTCVESFGSNQGVFTSNSHWKFITTKYGNVPAKRGLVSDQRVVRWMLICRSCAWFLQHNSSTQNCQKIEWKTRQHALIFPPAYTYLLTESVCHAHIGLFTFYVMTQQNATGRACDPKFELGLNFCTEHLATKFYRPMFIR